MRLCDLKELCDLYVPKASRHDRSFDVGCPKWWPAHELGHLLVAAPNEIGVPMFGLYDADDKPGGLLDVEITEARRRYMLSVECAAMTLSERLLINVGYLELAMAESEDTDYDTMTWWDDHRPLVADFVRSRCPRLPRNRDRLERLLQRRLAPRYCESIRIRVGARVADHPCSPIKVLRKVVEGTDHAIAHVMLHDLLTLLIGAALVSIGVVAGGVADRIRGLRMERRAVAPYLPRASTTAKVVRAAAPTPPATPRAVRARAPSEPDTSKQMGETVIGLLVNTGYKKAESAMAVASVPDIQRVTLDAWVRAAILKLNSRSAVAS